MWQGHSVRPAPSCENLMRTHLDPSSMFRVSAIYPHWTRYLGNVPALSLVNNHFSVWGGDNSGRALGYTSHSPPALCLAKARARVSGRALASPPSRSSGGPGANGTGHALLFVSTWLWFWAHITDAFPGHLWHISARVTHTGQRKQIPNYLIEIDRRSDCSRPEEILHGHANPMVWWNVHSLHVVSS